MDYLKIVNGYMSFSFDSLVDTYTVFVDEDVDRLIFDYKLLDGYKIDIINNDITNDINFVYLEVKGDNDLTTYTFEVYKKTTEEVVSYVPSEVSLDVKNELEWYVKPAIFGICLLLILFLLFVFFKPRKRRRKN